MLQPAHQPSCAVYPCSWEKPTEALFSIEDLLQSESANMDMISAANAPLARQKAMLYPPFVTRRPIGSNFAAIILIINSFMPSDCRAPRT
jgi:hypothetical protein